MMSAGRPRSRLEPRKRLERRGRQHPAEIPDHRLDHHVPAARNIRLRTANMALAARSQPDSAAWRSPMLRRAIPAAMKISCAVMRGLALLLCRARARHRRRRRAVGRGRRPLRRHHRRLARQFLHRQPDRAETGADGGALRAARRGLQDRRIWRRRAAAIAGRAHASPIHPGFKMQAMLAHRATADVALLQLDIPAKGKTAGVARHAAAFRSPSAAASPSPASASPSAATARAAASSAPPAWSRPASPARCRSAWSIPSAQGTRDGLGACTGDSGGPVFEDKPRRARDRRRRQLVDRAERQRRLRRPDRRHAADALPRLDFADRAAMGFCAVSLTRLDPCHFALRAHGLTASAD